MLSILLALPISTHAKIDETQVRLLKENPAKAAAQFQEQLTKAPGDPWLIYNTAVAAYAASDYAKADELWQQLAAMDIPDELRDKVWLQIGNVSYRLVQPQLEAAPEAAIPKLEQSREALKVAVNFNKKNEKAAKNLKFIESVLEKLYARLAKQLVDQAKKESWAPKAIEKLEAALPYAQQALDLNPKNEQRQEEKTEVEKLLAEKLQERGAQAEKTADERHPENNDWEKKNAQENYEKAIADFQQAQALTPEDKKPQEAEKRVEEKLANMLAKAGRKEQQEAQQMAENRPEQAMEKLQDALENFEQAQAIQPEHADAKAGEKEVREQMEQMHLAQGDKQLEKGEQQKENQKQEAAQNLQQALQNFEAAQALDPQNAEIQPRIDKVEAMLPELLTQLAQQQQQRGEQAEKRNQKQDAVENYENAEQNFAQAQQQEPKNEAAKQGQKEVKEALDRLRKELAQEKEQQKGSKEEGKPQESFESMLAKVKEDEKWREMNARQNKGEKYNEDRDKNLRNW